MHLRGSNTKQLILLQDYIYFLTNSFLCGYRSQMSSDFMSEQIVQNVHLLLFAFFEVKKVKCLTKTELQICIDKASFETETCFLFFRQVIILILKYFTYKEANFISIFENVLLVMMKKNASLSLRELLTVLTIICNHYPSGY